MASTRCASPARRAHLVGQPLGLVHQQLDALPAFEHLFDVLHHDVLDLVDLRRHCVGSVGALGHDAHIAPCVERPSQASSPRDTRTFFCTAATLEISSGCAITYSMCDLSRGLRRVAPRVLSGPRPQDACWSN